MTGPEFYAIRKRLGLTALQWGRLLHYRGSDRNVRTQVSKMERGRKPIRPEIAALARQYAEHGLPETEKEA